MNDPLWHWRPASGHAAARGLRKFIHDPTQLRTQNQINLPMQSMLMPRFTIRCAVLFALMVHAGLAYTPFARAQVIYFTDRAVQGVQRANFDCSLVTEPLVPNAGLLPQALVLAPESNLVFWTDFDGGLIRRAGLDGADPITIVAGLIQPTALALDIDQGWLYVAELGSATISKVRFDGTDLQIVHSGIATFGIAFDPMERQLYWTSASAGAIFKSDELGDNVELAVDNAGLIPIGIAIDAMQRLLVWTDFLANQILAVDLNSGTINTIATAPASIGPTTMAVNPINQEVFWVNNADGSIWSGSYAGDFNNEVMISQAIDPYGIAVIPPPPPPQPGDINNDGVVNAADIAGFVGKLLGE